MAQHAATLGRRDAVARPRPRPGRWRLLRRLVREKPLGGVGALIVLLMLVLAVFADWIAPFPYDEMHLRDRLKPSSTRYLLGTDNMGRDLFSRIVYGARVSMLVGLGTVSLGTGLATLVGVLSAYFGGRLDTYVQRLVDAWQAFPWLVILLSIMAVIGPGLGNVILALGVLTAASGSRVIRSAVLAVREQPFIEAARAVGCGHARILLRYVLPNVVAPIIVLATVGLGAAILIEAALSFLGFGVPPPYPSWGEMLSGSGRSYMYKAPWMAIWPGVAISLAVFGFNMLGDALRDLLDPRLRGETRRQP
ncbi:MAG: peptide ABC transporter permease [Candidatus Tectimicrobiota bacterium]|nr:MAG: peptide ABC transporter permease [Candidatus Tectomicrobia bacterium]